MKTHTIKSWLAYFIVIFLAGIMFVSCQKENTLIPEENPVFPDPSTLPQGLIGTWVEINTLSDTLVFNSNEDSGLVFLYRGYEIRNGYYLPVIGTDGYFYQIENDSIRMRAGLSSLWLDKIVNFNFDEKNLTIVIGNFSDYIHIDEPNLTFQKIE